ncbi:hypothetical protein [Nocardia inohanensis]|uniref:hypothetical protein n=1 Tax=Nocardia inohanensis TaxID=209246 RepID=UPI00083133CA|nr:hypothetical protein [Nocardia inohanensis]
MEVLAAKPITYGTAWFLAGVVPVLFMISVLFYSVAWNKDWKDRLQGGWECGWAPLLNYDGEGDPNLFVWFIWHVIAVSGMVLAAVLSPATDIGGTALFAAELSLGVLIVLAVLVMLDGMPWRLAAAHAGLWFVRIQLVLFVVGYALAHPDDFTTSDA